MKLVKILSTYISRSFTKYWISIDREPWSYTVWFAGGQLRQNYTKLARYNKYKDLEQYILDALLPMDKKNPASTIDTFYKMLMLQ